MTAVAHLKQLSLDAGASIQRLSLVQFIAGATLFLLVYWGFSNGLARIAVQLALLAVVLRPALLESRVLWVILSIVNTVALVDGWVSADNYKYLTFYWVYVVTLAVSVQNHQLGESILAWHGRFFWCSYFAWQPCKKPFHRPTCLARCLK